MISCAVHANLAMHEDTADQQANTLGSYIEGASLKMLKFGFKYDIVDDSSNKRTAVFKICSSEISDITTTSSNFIHHYKTHKERWVNVSF